MTRHTSAALVFVSFVAAAAAGYAPRGAQPLLVGLLRADCVALPFASYADGKWERLTFSPPPASVEQLEGRWYFTGSNGQTRTLSGRGIVTFTGGDTFYEEWGVRTDHQPCHSGEDYPAERIGAVLSDATPVRPFRQSPGAPGSPELVSPDLRAGFDRLEAAALLKKEREEGEDAWRLGHPRDPSIRRRAALRVTELYGSSHGDTTFLYFVVRREYAAASADAPFDAISVLHGWGVRSGDKTVLQGLELILDSGSEMQVSTYTPYGLMVVDGDRYVIAERGGYESTSREVLRWTRAGPATVLPAF